VFLALHGTFGEDGTIQHLCEDLGLAYTGSAPRASRLGLDKASARRRFEEAGLAVPRWHLVDARIRPSPEAVLNGLAFPRRGEAGPSGLKPRGVRRDEPRDLRRCPGPRFLVR
jgi:D-alanine-D-alanine ligase-like ATP-grasp enzyme